MKTAFLFSGQGAQYLCMASDLYNEYEIVRDTFAEASAVLGYDLADVINNCEAKLNETKYTQPAILTVSIAIYRVLADLGMKPDAVAGLSLGEYSALVASGAISFKEAVGLVAKRGQYMVEAAPAGVGKMVAVMNANRTLIEETCKQASVKGIVSPANYNTPVQIVIGGEIAAVDDAVELLKAAGVKRTIELNVSGPFHTALLAPASEKLALELEKVHWQAPSIPVVSNTTANVFTKEEIVPLLTKQVMSSVRWYDSIDTLKNLGVTNFIEVGPGKVLSGFMKKIDKTAHTARVENLETLAELKAELESVGK
jgi:[acyl-carrier-protein] S-malonyltransferase